MGSIRAVRSGEVGRAWLVAPTVPLRYESELGGEASGLPTHSGRPQLLLPLLPSSSSPHFIHRPLASGPSLNSIGGPSHRHGSVLGVCRAEVGGGSFGSSACLVFVGWGCGCGPARSPSCRSPVFDVLCAAMASLTPASPDPHWEEPWRVQAWRSAGVPRWVFASFIPRSSPPGCSWRHRPAQWCPAPPRPATRNTLFLASSGYRLAFKCKKEVNRKRE